MNFKIEDILNNTIDGVSKEILTTVISEVINEENVVTAGDSANI